MAEAASVAESPAAKEAKSFAPQAFAAAEKLRNDAERAFDEDDVAGAQLLAERAIAAHARAFALARVAQAKASEESARKEHERLTSELTQIDAEQTRVAAEVRALEQRAQVVRETESLVPSKSADPAREKSRAEAAKALAIQAKLLCTGARLLVGTPATADETTTALGAAEEALTKLETALGAYPAPIDGASRARADCLRSLTLVRRARTPVTRAPGAADALLTALSASSALGPLRDDRGVVVTLRAGLFHNNDLTADGRRAVVDLAGHAAGANGVPMAVVVHQDRDGKAEDSAAEARGRAVETALREAGVIKVATVQAGTRAPLVDPRGASRSRNARVELVFVTPEAL